MRRICSEVNVPTTWVRCLVVIAPGPSHRLLGACRWEWQTHKPDTRRDCPVPLWATPTPVGASSTFRVGPLLFLSDLSLLSVARSTPDVAWPLLIISGWSGQSFELEGTQFRVEGSEVSGCRGRSFGLEVSPFRVQGEWFRVTVNRPLQFRCRPGRRGSAHRGNRRDGAMRRNEDRKLLKTRNYREPLPLIDSLRSKTRVVD